MGLEDNTFTKLPSKEEEFAEISNLNQTNSYAPTLQSLFNTDPFDSVSESSTLPIPLLLQSEDYLNQGNPTLSYNSPSPHFQTSSTIASQHDSGQDGARCRYCNTKMSSMLMLKLHEESIHGALDRHRCSWCRFGCDREENLFKHILESHPQRPLSDLECILCRKRFKKKSYRNKHFTRCHFRDDSNKTQIPPSYRTKYQKCVECDIWFRWVEDYNSHLKQCHSTPSCAAVSENGVETLAEIVPVTPELGINTEMDHEQSDALEQNEIESVESCGNLAYMCCGCNIGFSSEEKLLCHVQDTHE